MTGTMRKSLFLSLMILVLDAGLLLAGVAPEIITLKREDASGTLTVLIAGREAFVYRYGLALDLPHIWPLNTPSGRDLLVEKTEPYPHHRSFWFADSVKLDGGRDVSVYNGLYTGTKKSDTAYEPPFKDHIRHVAFDRCEAKGDRAEIVERLVWEMDNTVPVLDEVRRTTVHTLGGGEYLLDITEELVSKYGDVTVVSDEVHYAWPFLRLNTKFSGTNGGVLLSDTGARGEKETNLNVARWIDYSNALDGLAEGVAIFQWPDGQDHKWLTREYGCFGPRRPDAVSGKPFVLVKGMSVRQRVGVLVHSGDVSTGRIAERYKDYIGGKWGR
jgi:hypothetical protein